MKLVGALSLATSVLVVLVAHLPFPMGEHLVPRWVALVVAEEVRLAAGHLMAAFVLWVEYGLWHLVVCGAAGGACAPPAIVAGVPGATRGEVVKVEGHRRTGTPSLARTRASFPCQGLAPGSAVGVAVVVSHERPEPVVAVQAVLVGKRAVVVQQGGAVALDRDDPGHIASHSTAVVLVALVAFAGLRGPAVVGVVVFLVLRFPLFHRTALERFSFYEHQFATCRLLLKFL